eukprot:2008685-Pyramimonas_sp.AAC.1
MRSYGGAHCSPDTLVLHCGQAPMSGQWRAAGKTTRETQPSSVMECTTQSEIRLRATTIGDEALRY